MTIVTHANNGGVTVGNTTTLVIPANSDRKILIISNDSDEEIYVSFDSAAVMHKGLRLEAAGSVHSQVVLSSTYIYTGAVSAICTSGTKLISFIEA